MEYAKFNAYAALAMRTREAVSRVTMEATGTFYEAECSQPPRKSCKKKKASRAQCIPTRMTAAKTGKAGKAKQLAVDMMEESLTDLKSGPNVGTEDDGSASSSGSSLSNESDCDGHE